MEKQGINIIHLEVGQPNFPTPPHVIEATIAALRDGHTKYVANDGIAALKEEVSLQYYNKGIPTTPEQIVVTSGSMLAMYTLMAACLTRGDECLLPFPGFPNYQQGVVMAGATAVPYVTDSSSGYLPTIAALEGLVTPRTRMMVLCNPGNPTGACYPRELVRDIVHLTSCRGIFLISDG
jgi:aspartate/methionine/tyrosine aminotransferase